MRFFFVSISLVFSVVCYGLIFKVDSEESFLVLLLLFIVSGAMLLGIFLLGQLFYGSKQEEESES